MDTNASITLAKLNRILSQDSTAYISRSFDGNLILIEDCVSDNDLEPSLFGSGTTLEEAVADFNEECWNKRRDRGSAWEAAQRLASKNDKENQSYSYV